ncbi:hypothetical protein TNCT_167111 [Trichonephila clavata]|uniref:Uncharacterized protein n=1 Tax=Trichonephila clavata TaxID=2740835 RepID=A0A8X6GXI2_TRICU|nr:hypothetical protein TNCT_167111 [Trichonephila clavata]
MIFRKDDMCPAFSDGPRRPAKGKIQSLRRRPGEPALAEGSYANVIPPTPSEEQKHAFYSTKCSALKEKRFSGRTCVFLAFLDGPRRQHKRQKRLASQSQTGLLGRQLSNR